MSTSPRRAWGCSFRGRCLHKASSLSAGPGDSDSTPRFTLAATPESPFGALQHGSGRRTRESLLHVKLHLFSHHIAQHMHHIAAMNVMQSV